MFWLRNKKINFLVRTLTKVLPLDPLDSCVSCLKRTSNLRDFPTLDFGVKTSQNGVYHTQFLNSTFKLIFLENPNKISKVTDA